MAHNWRRYIPSWRLPLWQWGIVLVFCASTAVLFNTLFYLQYVASASQSSSQNVAFWTFLPSETTRRTAWMLVMPIALHYARALPIQVGKGARCAVCGVLLHIGISLGFGIASALVSVGLVFIIVPLLFPLRTLVSPMQELITHLTMVSGFVASVVLYWLILGGTNAFTYYRAFRDQSLRAVELEAQLAQAQLHALQMQLNPHFLFNALNSVSSLLYEDVRRADTMLARLGDFLRITLNAPLAQCVSLRQELDFVKRYLDIEQMRFEERVGVEWEISPDTLEASVPTFILQPLVENALKHGILRSTAGGTITICTIRRDQTLHIGVRNRSALSKEVEYFDTRPTTTHNGGNSSGVNTGIGLQNTRSRLEKLYPGAYSLDYGLVEDNGYAVAIHIPFQLVSTQ